MTRQIKKRKITVRGYAMRSLIQSTIYFFVLFVWQLSVYCYNKTEIGDFPPVGLLLFLLIFVIWFTCYFEIRTLTTGDARFLGYKSYILFFSKLCCLPIIVLCTAIIFRYTDLIIYYIVATFIPFALYYLYFIITMYAYRTFIKNDSGELYISYQVRVKKWYIEGAIV